MSHPDHHTNTACLKLMQIYTTLNYELWETEIFMGGDGWLRSTVGGTPVFGRRTDPVLRSTFS